MFKGLFGPSFSKKTLKPHLKQAAIRFNVHKQKRTNSLKQERRALAGLLKEGKVDAARIRAEAVIRTEREDQASEILSLMCNLLHERVDLIASTKDCPVDLKESVCTVMWATNRVQIAELKTVKEQFGCRYGEEFKKAAANDIGSCVNPRVKNYLNVMPPSTEQVVSKLREIAEEHKVEFDAEKLGKVWAPEAEPLPPLPPMSGDSGFGGGGAADPAAFGGPIGPDGSRGPEPRGAPAPYGGGAPDPYGGGAPAPYGGGAPAPYGGGAPAPYGGGAPAPYGGGAPAPYGGRGPEYPMAPSYPAKDMHGIPPDAPGHHPSNSGGYGGGGDIPAAFPMPGPRGAPGAPGAPAPSGGIDPGLPALPSYGAAPGTTTVPPGHPGPAPAGSSSVGIDEIEAKFRKLREAHGGGHAKV